ncbi:MAG: phosphomannomutase/phosphoglucomutase [bacterium]|nr:phosphomannomutase/phosphoglucomutase [bacterium]
MIKKEIFREYDIRGIYEEELNSSDAYLIGQALGTIMLEKKESTTIVGQDNRMSSPILTNQLIKGLLNTGINVIDIGIATTPMVMCACDILNIKCRIAVTASHNPKEYNGFKISYNGTYNACGKEIEEIYNVICNNKFKKGIGEYHQKNINKEYIDMIIKDIKLQNKKKIIYDCGNGTTSIIIKEVLSKLNVNSIGLFDISDGNFPNHHPDPSLENNLQRLKQSVIENKADIGIAFDGDGDRVGIVDELGNVIPTDKLMIIVIRAFVNQYKNKGILYDIKCSKALEDEIIKLKLKPVICRTGASYTRKKLYTNKYPFGGELSGHMYFNDRSYPGYDDGIYNALRIIEILTNSNKPLSKLLNNINLYYSTKELIIKVTDTTKFAIVNEVKNYCETKKYNFLTIDGVKIIYEDATAVIRASNTGPNLTLRFEATTEEKLKLIQDEYMTLLNKLIK